MEPATGNIQGAQPASAETHALACLEVWGGNTQSVQSLDLPGLRGWVYSRPLEAEAQGGDVYYISVCNGGVVSRIALADVAGHGRVIGGVAANLRKLMHKHVNTWDQSDFMRDLDQNFQGNGEYLQYATGVVLGFYAETGQLLYTNAGHLSPLWYRAAARRWEWLDDSPEDSPEGLDMPIGLIPGTQYRQVAFRLAPGDLLLLYTDGIAEARDAAGEELGRARLLELVQQLPTTSAAAAGETLITALRAFSEGAPAHDDETLIVIERRA